MWLDVLRLGLVLSCIYLRITSGSVIEDGYLLDTNTIHGSEPEIPLESFFWTGSGDGPPPLQPPKPINSHNRDVFIKTSTVLATVYIDGQSPMDDDPLCVYNCDPPRSEDQKLQNSTIAFARSDRRFWLLTIVAGFFSSSDIPLVEDHLAKLYRSAFARQQARHLGLTGNGRDSGEFNGITVQLEADQRPTKDVHRRRRAAQPLDDQIRPTRVLRPDGIGELSVQKNNLKISESPRMRQLPIPNSVRVIIHNMTHLTEAEILQRSLDNQVDFIDTTQSPNRNSSIGNQTEFVYTVFVGNKPILAVTASDDMRLVSTAEVVNTLGSQVLTKSEPYLKEPLATPLVPASPTLQKESNIFYYASENPIMFGILCASIFLLVFLLVGFLLMAKSKRAHSAEIRRLTAERSVKNDPERRRPIPKIPQDDLKENQDDDDDHGNDNMAFEGEYNDFGRRNKSKYENPPSIHFPLPPLHRPSSSSSATSDSSVYFNKRYRDEAQNILKEEPMFYKKQHQRQKNGDGIDDNDRIYAMVTKGQEVAGEGAKHKKGKKKRYLENRVGSVENEKPEVEVMSSPYHESSEITYAAPDNYEPMDAFNLREAQKIHERRSQQLKQALYGTGSGAISDFEIASSVINSPNEAVNREILKALHHKSSDQMSVADSGSIGSFLSMASLKSFPKCAVPEPLSRVLEPVTITHYDQSDQEERKIHKPSSSGSYKKQIIENFVNNERKILRPMAEDETDGTFKRTQSDGSDPGVVGPIVWEMHKKEMGKQKSPLRDPAKTRNRFEGLLEGAIRLYETSDDREVDSSRKPGVSFSRISGEMRGKSAVVTGMRPKMGILRPVTAMTTHDNDSRVSPLPSPSRSAWRSEAASPLVRPLSAGPFHRPEMNSGTTAINRMTPQSEAIHMSTEPLIQAIHQELKKFNRNNGSLGSS